jgi:transposase
MKAISAAQHNSVVSLLNEGYSQRQIKAKTGLGKGTISRISKEVDGNKENNPGGRPSKLSARDKQSIVRQIKSGKLENAVEATQFINGIIPNPVTPQTVRNALKESRFYSATKKKTPLLKRAHRIWHLHFANIMKTGLWRTGKCFYGQMKPKSIGLGQMERLISGKKRENHYLTEQHHLLSNMEEEETSWYGVVWGGMEWESS